MYKYTNIYNTMDPRNMNAVQIAQYAIQDDDEYNMLIKHFKQLARNDCPKSSSGTHDYRPTTLLPIKKGRDGFMWQAVFFQKQGSYRFWHQNTDPCTTIWVRM